MQAWTWVHPDSDLVAVRFEAPGWEVDQIAVVIAFPYGSAIHTGDPADWTQPDRHLTELERSQNGAVSWRRTLDDDTYWVDAAWTEGGRLERQGAHTFRLAPPVQASVFEFAVRFSPAQTAGEMPRAGTVRDASARHWNRFWTGGGTLDLSDSSDPRAPELERRIVLSEFLTSVQCAGSMPPQETGLTFNSWHGKFHLEMHWWHATHFALWDRVAVLERSLQWYKSVLPVARETARQQGYTGARWPKMVGPNGRESPSTINPFLVWQQPHPIYFAELVYRSRPEAGVLDAYGELVSESARFIASFLVRDAATGQFHLVPPLIPAQEIHSPESTVDPAFELAYFEYGLKVAQAWRERAGLKRMAAWDDILRNLAPIPHHEGLYVNAASAPDTFLNPEQRRDHPSLLGAYGMIPSERVDRRMMRRTLERVIQDWQWDETWGWDYPLVAMTAARVGQPSLAVDALLMDTPRNQYLPNGHNYQRPGLSIYLPGNGGLLAATAMMAAGWDGGPTGPAPGFPAGGWVIRSEGLQRMP